jgi:hypothetical protein
MVWFLVDDVLPFHERVLRAGNAAMGLWVRAGAWCSGQLTDGFIPVDVARTMGSPAEIRKLVSVGLWSPETRNDQQGYLFHAWAEDGTGQKRQPTKAEVEDRRRKDREKKQRQRRNDHGQYVPEGVPQGHPEGVPTVHTKPYQTPLLASLEGGASAPTPPVDNSLVPGLPPLPFCPEHPGGTTAPCIPCKLARLAAEGWKPIYAKPERKPIIHMEGLCDAHRQPEATCEMCIREARETVQAQFGGTA